MANPYHIETPALISFSGGRTSGYLLRPMAFRVLGCIRRLFLPSRRITPVPEPKATRPDIVTICEVDYFALAGSLIDQHGPAARTEAVRLREEALQEDDQLAVTDWHAVEQAIALLSIDSAVTRH